MSVSPACLSRSQLPPAILLRWPLAVGTWHGSTGPILQYMNDVQLGFSRHARAHTPRAPLFVLALPMGSPASQGDYLFLNSRGSDCACTEGKCA